MKYNELYKICIDKLNASQIKEAESDTRLFFHYILGMERSDLFMKANCEVDDTSVEKLLSAISLREKRIPLQHITGKQEFMGLEFDVSKDVLIPRFDTECLVEEAMLVCCDGDKVLDVCTGSGCILISLMNYKNDISGYGVDISKEALEIAKRNAEKLCKRDELPRFYESDLFDQVEEKDFDVIVSNPPYIRSEVIKELEPEVREFDPMLALDGGEDGLIFYRRITSKAGSYLKKGGHLLVEIGFDQGNDVKKLFMDNGFSDVKIVKDLSGNDRVVRGRYV